MKPYTHPAPRPLVHLLAFVCLGVAALPAQTVPAAPANIPAGEATVVLSPFVVSSERDVGYTATSSLAGGRTNALLLETPSAISVMTEQFLQDIGATNLNTLAEWSTNTIPAYERYSFSTGDFDIQIRGLGSSFPSRNYFLWYIDSDSYNTERFEFARGPNGVLFGDGNVGGIVTTFTKRPRFDRSAYTAELRVDSYGAVRATVDLNQPVTERLALRLNTLFERGTSWRDHSDRDREGWHLSGIVKVTDRNLLRFEGEWGNVERQLYRTTYTDQVSFWNGTTTYDGVAAPSTSGTGVSVISSNVYNVFIPTLPSAGILNWQGFYQTNGSGLAVRPPGEANFQSRAPVLPSREFNLQPVDSVTEIKYYTGSVYFDHRFSENLFAEVAWNRVYSDYLAHVNEDLFSTYRIDVNQVLPNGDVNPNFGLPFADSQRLRRYSSNRVDELRGLATWRIPTKWFDQRFSLITGVRQDKFDQFRERVYRTNGTNPNFTHASNLYRERIYWNKPGVPLGELPQIAGYTFDWLPERIIDENKWIKYAQITSMTRLFDERLTVMLGARRDHLYRTQQTSQGIPTDPVTGLPQLGATIIPPGGTTPVNQVGATAVTDVSTTNKNGGFVFFPIPAIGVFANYSETFAPPSSGANLIDGSVPGISRSQGYDFGIKLNLFNGKLSGSIGYYDVTQEGLLIGGSRTTEINRIWTNLGRDDLANLAFRDTQDNAGTGYEIDLSANPTRNVRLTFNLALPETEAINLQPGLIWYVSEHLATWQAGANDAGNPNRVQIQTDIDAIQSTIAQLTPGTTLNHTYKYTSNIYGTYTFTDGALRGLGIGAGANLRGRNKVGNSQASAYEYLYADSYMVANAHISYRKRFGRFNVRFQVNVYNVFDNDELVVTSYGDYREGGLSSNPAIRVPNNFRYLDPRRFTFSTTIDF